MSGLPADGPRAIASPRRLVEGAEIERSELPFERHVALFQWTWASGAGKHEVVLSVKNLSQV